MGMEIAKGIYHVLNYFFPQAFPLTPEKTAEETEEQANQACWQDIYSEPCARLSDLAEQKGGINVRNEMMDLDARIRPLLNDFLSKNSLEGGMCAQIDPSSALSSETSCYEVLQCTAAASDPIGSSLQIYLEPSPE